VIPLDAGLFGQVPDQVYGVEQARNIRKIMERCFNLLKYREGLEPHQAAVTKLKMRTFQQGLIGILPQVGGS
jgi:hypothetical protein